MWNLLQFRELATIDVQALGDSIIAIKKVQFQPGLSLPKFIDHFDTEAKCRRAPRRAQRTSWQERAFGCLSEVGVFRSIQDVFNDFIHSEPAL